MCRRKAIDLDTYVDWEGWKEVETPGVNDLRCVTVDDAKTYPAGRKQEVGGLNTADSRREVMTRIDSDEPLKEGRADGWNGANHTWLVEADPTIKRCSYGVQERPFLLQLMG